MLTHAPLSLWCLGLSLLLSLFVLSNATAPPLISDISKL